MAATSVLAVAAGIAVVSSAGAAQETKISIVDGSTPCFTTTPGTCPAGGGVNVTVHTGDKVTWDFEASTNIHNVAAADKNDTTPSDPEDPVWDAYVSEYHLPPGEGTESYVFGKPGVYKFVCQIHKAAMYGTITVEGDEVETPTPTPTATATATASPTATPTFAASPAPTPGGGGGTSVDDHTSTPAPGKASSAKDTTAPRLEKVSAKRRTGGARLRFWVSEAATVSIKVKRKGSKKTVTSTVVQAPQGTRSFVLRSKSLKRRGTYKVSFAPVDAMGNDGRTRTATLKIK
jgi:plastocyanin